jgi:1-deoxyxylulose-5-phosphate synthase
MQYIHLGKTGLKVSRICVGCMSFGDGTGWMLNEEQARPIIHRALDAGINYFDTADVYSDGLSEKIVGAELAGHPDVIVATKVGLPFDGEPKGSGLSPKWIRHQIEGSLHRLQRKRVDLYQIHRWDYATPIDETLRTLNDLVKEGKVAHLGASSMYSWQFFQSLVTAERDGLASFATMQNRYNLIYREEEREMVPLCQQYGIAMVPYSPLAGGFLSGDYRPGSPRDSARYRASKPLQNLFAAGIDFPVVDVLREIAEQRQVRPAQVALAWLLTKPTVASVIQGLTRPEQLDDAIAAVDLRLSADEIARLEEKYVPHRLIGPIPPPTVA